MLPNERTTRAPARRRGGLPALLSALALAAAACGDAQPKRNLLVVSFDTLRADRTGPYGNDDWGTSPTPNLDRLAAHGTTFDHALATRGQTHPSLAAMLTGKYPITTGVRENGFLLLPQHETFIEALRRQGWQTGVFVSNFDVSLGGDAWVFRGAMATGDGFHGRRKQEGGPRESRFQHIWDDRVEESATGFLEHVDRNRPWAAWVHFYDVHKPYNPPEGFDLYGHADGLPAATTAPGPDSGDELENYLAEITLGDRELPATELRRILGLYDGAVTATDARLGRLLDKLEALGELDETYLVFTADHGEELFDHNRYFFHGSSIYNGTLHLPLIVAGPGLPAGARLGQTVQNIDIAPTVCELLGADPPEGIEGVSLVPLLTGRSVEPPRPFSFIEWQDVVYVVTDGRHAYVHNPQHAWTLKSPYFSVGGGKPTKGFAIDCFEGYDLSVDPLQQKDLLAGHAIRSEADLPEEYRPLLAALKKWLADPRHEKQLSYPGMSPERLDQLRQIGYLDGSTQRDDVMFMEPCR